MPELILTIWLLVLAVPPLHAAGDPTLPPDWARAPVSESVSEPRGRPRPELLLQQIVMGQTRCAVINQRLLREGDEIEGYRVHRIFVDQVLLSGRQEQRTLSLIRESVRSNANGMNADFAVSGQAEVIR